MINDIINISINPSDYPFTDRGYDFSLLNSVNTCPMYGITRHVLQKNFTNNDRHMALECGDLCHKCFACYRALSIYFRGIKENKETLCLIGKNYIVKLFQEITNNELDFEKCNEIFDEFVNNFNENDTLLSKYTTFSDFIIDNSGYYDDPDDKKRTISNIKDSLMHYCSNFLNLVEEEPVWIENENDINSKIGIEIPFDTKVVIIYEENGKQFEQAIHFIGKLDGLHVRLLDNSLIVHENKTASRLDDSWLGQWFKSHQITGYCLAASYFSNGNCLQARVLGMQIPAPKTSGYAFRTQRVDREDFYFIDWARWVLSVHKIIEDYKNNPEIAPMNTHACCKYYKQCSFTPLCCASIEERKEIIEKDMVEDAWSPLDE